jgi:hypothetical protein
VEPEMSAICLVATCPQEASRETAKAPEIVIKYLLTQYYDKRLRE